MSNPKADPAIKTGDGSIDVIALVNWANEHIWVFLLIAAVLFIFFLFQRGGFAEKYLEYRTKREELDANKARDMRVIVEMFRRRHDREDPLLPLEFGDGPDDRP